MPNISCPTGVVNAPVEAVWNLLTDPAGWSAFFDIRVTHIIPPGPAVVGQRVFGESGLTILHLAVTFEYTEIDASRRTFGLNVQLPLGITVRENLSCSAIGDRQCRVIYHCDFGFPTGWRGAIARMILRRELETGPEDSLSRLTRAAELVFSRESKNAVALRS